MDPELELTRLPTLITARLRLVPLGPEHFEATWVGLHEVTTRRLTGTRTVFTEQAVREGLAGLAARADRGDWAITVTESGAHLGEVVLNQLDAPNASMNFRIALWNESACGQGYGTEATQAVVDYGLDVLALHRIQLEVFSFNPRAKRVYEKCGFRTEGRRRDALLWDGEWFDAETLAILSTDRPAPAQ